MMESHDWRGPEDETSPVLYRKVAGGAIEVPPALDRGLGSASPAVNDADRGDEGDRRRQRGDVARRDQPGECRVGTRVDRVCHPRRGRAYYHAVDGPARDPSPV